MGAISGSSTAKCSAVIPLNVSVYLTGWVDLDIFFCKDNTLLRLTAAEQRVTVGLRGALKGTPAGPVRVVLSYFSSEMKHQ